MMGWIGGSVVFKFLFSRLGGVGAGGGWLGDGGGPPDDRKSKKTT